MVAHVLAWTGRHISRGMHAAVSVSTSNAHVLWPTYYQCVDVQLHASNTLPQLLNRANAAVSLATPTTTTRTVGWEMLYTVGFTVP